MLLYIHNIWFYTMKFKIDSNKLYLHWLFIVKDWWALNKIYKIITIIVVSVCKQVLHWLHWSIKISGNNLVNYQLNILLLCFRSQTFCFFWAKYFWPLSLSCRLTSFSRDLCESLMIPVEMSSWSTIGFLLQSSEFLLTLWQPFSSLYIPWQ